jgi:hypothetical protein
VNDRQLTATDGHCSFLYRCMVSCCCAAGSAAPAPAAACIECLCCTCTDYKDEDVPLANPTQAVQPWLTRPRPSRPLLRLLWPLRLRRCLRTQRAAGHARGDGCQQEATDVCLCPAAAAAAVIIVTVRRKEQEEEKSEQQQQARSARHCQNGSSNRRSAWTIVIQLFLNCLLCVVARGRTTIYYRFISILSPPQSLRWPRCNTPL